jgi:hypothetical protein
LRPWRFKKKPQRPQRSAKGNPCSVIMSIINYFFLCVLCPDLSGQCDPTRSRALVSITLKGDAAANKVG